MDISVVGFAVTFLVLINVSIFIWLIIPLYHKYKIVKKIFFKGVMVKGVIIGNNTWLDADRIEQYAPIVRFLTKDGVSHVIESDTFNLKMPELDTEIQVCYVATDPPLAVIDPAKVFVTQLFYLIMVLVFLLIVNVLFLKKSELI